MQTTKIKRKLLKYSKQNKKLQKTNLCKFVANKDNCKWEYCITKIKKLRNRKLCDKNFNNLLSIGSNYRVTH